MGKCKCICSTQALLKGWPNNTLEKTNPECKFHNSLKVPYMLSIPDPKDTDEITDYEEPEEENNILDSDRFEFEREQLI